MEHFYEEAQLNLQGLQKNPYPGRGIVIGLSSDERYYLQACWTMGRSESSRNRLYVKDDRGSVRTTQADPSQGGDTSLIVYRAMGERRGRLYVVSNGDQTDDILDDNGLFFLDLPSELQDRTYEPDYPNNTPRITGALSLKEELPVMEMAILRKSPFSDACERIFYQYNHLQGGLGHCVTTYMGDGSPLPSFHGEPYLLPLGEGAVDTMALLWDALDPDNRVSLAVKAISVESGHSEIEIINKYVPVP